MSKSIMVASDLGLAHPLESEYGPYSPTTVTTTTRQGLTGVDVPEAYRGLTTVSAVIRAMDKDGYKTARIAAILGKRYQHVRNVLKAEPKKA